MKRSVLKRIILFGLLVTIGLFARNNYSYAQSVESVDITYDSEEYGLVTESLGVIVPASISPDMVSQLKATFPVAGVYLKIVNPTVTTVNSASFRSLYESNFNWYFSFTTPNAPFPTIDAYKTNFSIDRLVVEVEKDDLVAIGDLKGTYPTLKIHAGNLPVWPRSQVNEILEVHKPPQIEGISFWLGLIDKGDGVYPDVEFAFDTLFDASKAIAGEKVHFPANTILAISDNRFPSYTGQQKTAYLSGLLSGVAITTVQSQGRGGEAPIRYVIPGTFSQFSQSDKMVLSHFARFVSLSPRIVWPYAIPNNGDIWDNGIFEKSNTKPVVGVIGKLTDGYYGFITNASGTQRKADFSAQNDIASYTKVSTTKAQVNYSNRSLLLDPHETVIFHPTSLPNPPTPTMGAATATPGGPTATPTPINQTACADKQKNGDYNCNDVINEEDFTSWLSDFKLKKNAYLTLFEYWRRSAL